MRPVEEIDSLKNMAETLRFHNDMRGTIAAIVFGLFHSLWFIHLGQNIWNQRKALDTLPLVLQALTTAL